MKQAKNRMVLLLIAGIPVTMILAASWLWFYVAKGDLDLVGALGTANSGSLVQPPRQMNDLALYNEEGVSLTYSELDRKWTFLVPAGAKECDAACEAALYITRQIHVAIGKDFNRIQRVYLSEYAPDDIPLVFEQLSDERPTPNSFSDLLHNEHKGLRFLRTTQGTLKQIAPERMLEQSTWYLVDPAGWVMMSYTDEVSYKDVISDLKFLLKNSRG